MVNTGALKFVKYGLTNIYLVTWNTKFLLAPSYW